MPGFPFLVLVWGLCVLSLLGVHAPRGAELALGPGKAGSPWRMRRTLPGEKFFHPGGVLGPHPSSG